MMIMLEVYRDRNTSVCYKNRIRIRIRICIHVRRFLFHLSKYFRNLSRNVAPNAKGLTGPPPSRSLNEAFQSDCCWIILFGIQSVFYFYRETNYCQQGIDVVVIPLRGNGFSIVECIQKNE